MVRVFLCFLFLSFSGFCQEIAIANKSSILVHNSTYYHLQTETTNNTQSLIDDTQGDVIGLFQKNTFDKMPWYIPTSNIEQMIPSRAGEHDLYIESNNKLEVTMTGGYFTHCLARAVSHLIQNQLKYNPHPLKIILPSSTIFTGHIIENGMLVLQTAYQESILDDTVQGINLNQVLQTFSYEQVLNYLEEAISIGIINYKAISEIKHLPLHIDFYYNEKLIKTYKNLRAAGFVIEVVITD